MNHSPGPWTVKSPPNDPNAFDVYSSEGGKVVHGLWGHEADSRLAAAAPEMFELLEDLDQIMITALHNGHHDLIARTKEVLKKARGE